jgi:hypothetical protein
MDAVSVVSCKRRFRVWCKDCSLSLYIEKKTLRLAQISFKNVHFFIKLYSCSLIFGFTNRVSFALSYAWKIHIHLKRLLPSLMAFFHEG